MRQPRLFMDFSNIHGESKVGAGNGFLVGMIEKRQE
jgi:hypothetical protein